MFHIVLIFLPIIFLILLCLILLFALASVAIGIFGGTTTMLLVKNRKVKQVMVINCVILVLVGFLILSPLLSNLIGIPNSMVPNIAIVFLGSIGILAIGGIKISNSIQNRIGKLLLITLFCLISVAAGIFIFILVN